MSNSYTRRLQVRRTWIFAVALLLTAGIATGQPQTTTTSVTATGQAQTTTTHVIATGPEYPKAEVAIGYSLVNVHPGASPLTSFNMNGGGAAFVFNVTRLVGIKAEFMDYTGGVNAALKAAGFNANASANLFTYVFGPQIKKHSGRFEPFGEALFGAGHSGGFATLYNDVNGAVAGAGSSNNAFAMELGLGVDIPVGKHIAIRPVEVDYLRTKFGTQNISSSQNNFRYMAGINIGFGRK
jgi:hypothetical protein